MGREDLQIVGTPVLIPEIWLLVVEFRWDHNAVFYLTSSGGERSLSTDSSVVHFICRWVLAYDAALCVLLQDAWRRIV